MRGMLPLMLATAAIGCLPPKPPVALDVSKPEARIAQSNGQDGGLSSECDVLDSLWIKEVEVHRACKGDSDCAPTQLRNSTYECTAVNREWWELERERLAPAANACSRIKTISPACCVVFCERGTCGSFKSHGSFFCAADGLDAGFGCPGTGRCELEQERLWCKTRISPGVGYCVEEVRR